MAEKMANASAAFPSSSRISPIFSSTASVAALARVRSVRDGDDAAAVRAAVGHLNQATAAFAARRMDRGVRRALAGRAVDTLA